MQEKQHINISQSFTRHTATSTRLFSKSNPNCHEFLPLLRTSALYVLTARRSAFKVVSLNLRSPAGPSDSFPAPNKISNVLHPMTRVLNSIC